MSDGYPDYEDDATADAYALYMDAETRARCRRGDHDPSQEDIEGLVDRNGRVSAFKVTCGGCGKALRYISEDDL